MTSSAILIVLLMMGAESTRNTVPMTTSEILIVLLMMGAGSTRNMYSNLAEKNKCD
jgi:uncharacterized membrane protein YjdF